MHNEYLTSCCVLSLFLIVSVHKWLVNISSYIIHGPTRCADYYYLSTTLPLPLLPKMMQLFCTLHWKLLQILTYHGQSVHWFIWYSFLYQLSISASLQLCVFLYDSFYSLHPLIICSSTIQIFSTSIAHLVLKRH